MTTPRDPNTPRNPDQLIDAFLDEGPMDLRDQVLDEVRLEVDRTEQRTTFGPWRNLVATRFAGFAAVGAVVILAVAVAVSLGGGPLIGGDPSPSPSAQPSVAPSEPAPEAEPSAPAGSPVVWLGGDPGNCLSLTVTITPPSRAWTPEPCYHVIERDGGSGPPDGAAIMVFASAFHGWLVPPDPCHAESTLPQDFPADRTAREALLSSTVDELVAAFAAQASRDASAPVDITVGGHAGKSITLHVPDPLPADCDNDLFCSFVNWIFGAGPFGTVDRCDRIAQGPGQVDELWIVNVDGTAVIIDGAYYPDTPDEHVAEIRAIVDSMTIGPNEE